MGAWACLLGTDIDRPAYLDALRRTGIVPQGPGMYTDLSVTEYLDFARRLYGRGEAARLEERLDLGPHRRMMLAHPSGGYQRRVVLVAALLAEPELLDEPTVGPDPVAAHEVHALLPEAMRLPGRTTLLCTHNLAEAEALCEDVISLRGGKVRVQATLADLRRPGRGRPCHWAGTRASRSNVRRRQRTAVEIAVHATNCPKRVQFPPLSLTPCYAFAQARGLFSP